MTSLNVSHLTVNFGDRTMIYLLISAKAKLPLSSDLLAVAKQLFCEPSLD
jgi:hypothetical protein